MQKISPICVSNLLKLARSYAAHEGLALGTVGRYFHGTSGIFEAMESGERTIGLTTYDEIVEKFRAKWPKGHPWPKIKEPFRERKGGLRSSRRLRKASAEGADLHGER